MKDMPDIAHIGLFAIRDMRVSRNSNRMNVGTRETQDIVTGLEHTREA